MNVHSRRHSGPVPEQQQQCKECFVVTSDIRQHHEQFHPDIKHYYCDGCDYFCKSQNTLSKHKTQKKHNKPEPQPEPIYQHVKYTIDKRVKLTEEEREARLKRWDEIYQGINDVPYANLVDPTGLEAGVIMDFVNRHWGEDRDLIFHMVTHPDARIFGKLIYVILPYAVVCSCNLLEHLEPGPIPDEDKKHCHYMVMLNRVLLDKNLRTDYMSTRTDAGKTTFFKMNSKMHCLTTTLYLMGKKSHLDVSCHNVNIGFSQAEKESIRMKIQNQDPSFQFSKKELQRQKAWRMGCDLPDDLPDEEPEVRERRKWTRWQHRYEAAEKQPPECLAPYYWDQRE